MKILFLHGWHSTPGGLKPTYLKDHGHKVLNPALPDDDFGAAVRIAQIEFDQHQPDVVVGSSRGGAVAMNINSGSTPLVLLCPAWKKWGIARFVLVPTVILHSPKDDVVPFADSQELWRNCGLPLESLVAVGTDHRLADPESLGKMLEAVEWVTAPVPQTVIHEYGVPRRFGVGTLLIITTMYAVIFAILRACGASPSDYALVGLFTFAIGLGQMFLFKGQRPRRASIIVGACICVVCSIMAVIREPERLNTMGLIPIIFLFAIVGPYIGAVCGYIAGLLIAGVFLVADKIENRFSMLTKSGKLTSQHQERPAAHEQARRETA